MSENIFYILLKCIKPTFWGMQADIYFCLQKWLSVNFILSLPFVECTLVHQEFNLSFELKVDSKKFQVYGLYPKSLIEGKMLPELGMTFCSLGKSIISIAFINFLVWIFSLHNFCSLLFSDWIYWVRKFMTIWHLHHDSLLLIQLSMCSGWKSKDRPSSPIKH